MYQEQIKSWQETYSVKASSLAIKELLNIIQEQKEESFTIGWHAAWWQSYDMEELLWTTKKN